jgi:hypothetical protein
MVSSSPTIGNLGFLSIFQESNHFLGGYLVTNQWGRPVEFRLCTAVQPNRVQQILYGQTLDSYICADLIGKTLLEKTSAPADVVVTDNSSALELRLQVDIPMVWVGAKTSSGEGNSLVVKNFRRHPHFPQDAKTLQNLLKQIHGILDLSEPFLRIREALNEARKMGVTNRG